MFKTISYFRKLKEVMVGADINEVEAKAVSIVNRNRMNTKVEVSVVYYMPFGFNDKHGVYNHTEGKLYINANVFTNASIRNLIVGQYGSLDVYLDVLVSHELGHAFDPNFEGLAIMANNIFLPAQSRKEATLLLEKNAWAYGKQYTLYPEMYEQFNRTNMDNYIKALSI